MLGIDLFWYQSIRLADASGPAPHRYWRFTNWLNGDSGSFLELSEIRLTLAGTAVDSGATITGTTPDVGSLPTLIDGDFNTRLLWFSHPASPVTYDLGSPKLVDGFKVWASNSGNAGSWSPGVDIEFSNNGTSWTKAMTATFAYPGTSTGVQSTFPA